MNTKLAIRARRARSRTVTEGSLTASSGAGVEIGDAGLAIVRDIVERHRGTIEVADAAAGPGAGARFTVRMPRRQD